MHGENLKLHDLQFILFNNALSTLHYIQKVTCYCRWAQQLLCCYRSIITMWSTSNRNSTWVHFSPAVQLTSFHAKVLLL